MALAYSEGECFFKREALKNSFFSAEKNEDFYSNMLVEFVWNQPADRSVKVSLAPHGHPRSYHANGDMGTLDICGWFTQLPFAYGPKYKNRMVKGVAAEAWFMVMPMPTKAERWLWIDILTFIRSIYIPIAQQSSEQYQNLCTYVQVNFTRRTKDQQMWYATQQNFVPIGFDKTFGIPVSEQYTLGLDIVGLAGLLSLPRQLRKTNSYAAKLICVIYRDSLKTISFSSNYRRLDKYNFNYTVLSQASTGLELIWKQFTPKENAWFVEYFKNVTIFALGFVPVVGFLLQIGFTLGWTALMDSDNFMATLKATIPAVGLTDGVISELRKEADEIKGYLPPGWDQAGAPFQQQSKLTQGSVDLTDKDPPPDINPVGEGESFIKGSKVLAKSATTEEPVVEVNVPQ